MKFLRVGLLAFVSLFLASSAFAASCDTVVGFWYGKLTAYSTPCSWHITLDIDQDFYDSSILTLRGHTTSDNPICMPLEDEFVVGGRCNNGYVQINAGAWGIASGNIRDDGKLDLSSSQGLFSLKKLN